MKELSRKTVFEGFLNIEEITLETSQGEVIQRQVMSRGHAVSAVIYDTSKQKFIFARQYRQGAKSQFLEIVAGGMKPGEDPVETIKREILEEVGYKSDKVTMIDKSYPSPGGCTEIIYNFYVEVSEQIEDGGGVIEEHEDIEIVEMSDKEVYEYQFEDMKTLSTLRAIGAVKNFNYLKFKLN